MNLKTIAGALRLAALSAACLLQAPAQAGLVSGAWDPAFGSTLPGLNWAAYAELSVPNACTDLPGNQSITGDCAGAKVLGVFLRLYDTGAGLPDWTNPATYFSSLPNVATFSVCDSSVAGNPAFTGRCFGNFSNYFDLQGLRMEGGLVAGLQTTVSTTFLAVASFAAGQDLPVSAQGHSFSLAFTLNGPVLSCITCNDGPIASQTEGLRQFLVTYNSDDTSDPKFTDSTGKAVGILLDKRGQVLGRATSIDGTVPEPGSLALVAGALAAAALARRRRR